MYNTWVNGYHRARRRPKVDLSGHIDDDELTTDAGQSWIAMRSAEAEALEVLRNFAIAEAIDGVSENLRPVVRYADVEGARAMRWSSPLLDMC